MEVLLFLFVPLVAVVVLAVVVDRRRHRGASGGTEISEGSARAIAEARSAEHLPGGGPIAGV